MKQTYDFIVVGAGSAGCVLVNRLSADPDNSVLLLEAGGKDSNPMIRIPLGFSLLMGEGKGNRGYKTQAEQSLNEISGNINAAALMIAERCAEWMLTKKTHFHARLDW